LSAKSVQNSTLFVSGRQNDTVLSNCPQGT
jgi:hypothetical protein